ncbi:MAG: MFS transporter [Chlamydiales bacterium]|nr:MFS transporter [Chlamydiales bacterium]
MGLLARLKKHDLLPVFLTYFLDNFGLAIIYPIFTPLFFQKESFFFDATTTYMQKTILLGLLIGAFPLAQFFGAPLIGQFSDRFGRKRAFYITILGTAFGYTLTAFSILEHFLSLLFISRILTGLCAGNLTICLAAIADRSVDQKIRTKNFGSIAAIGGLSFILAILLGGILSNPEHHPLFHASFTFWITAFLSYINFFFMILSHC